MQGVYAHERARQLRGANRQWGQVPGLGLNTVLVAIIYLWNGF